MIPVTPQPEPAHFDQTVRAKGRKFLQTVPYPKTKQWKGKEYWQDALSDMRSAYKKVCAYCATWIPHSTGSHSIDHFVPKSQTPSLAYEWSNFRYVSARFNSRKGTRTILDPFTLQPDWFVLDFMTFCINPNKKLSPEQKRGVQQTIDYLKLNDDDVLIDERVEYVTDYRNGHISFAHLKKQAPFIAYELERQGIVK